MLVPLKNRILFHFVDRVKDGKFIRSETEQGLIIDFGNDYNYSASNCRVGIVESVGPDVTEYKKGDHILIKPLMWSEGILEHQDGDTLWVTDEDQVVGVFHGT